MVDSKPPKILLIRFSSFGDVTEALSVPTRLAELSREPLAEIHWVTRKDLAVLVKGHPFVQKIWELDRKQGLSGLWTMIQALKREQFTHIYDAHNNLRSFIISAFLRPPLALDRLFLPPVFLRKSQKRWKRFLLFRLRINKYEMPFSGQRDLLEPLQDWGLSKELPPAPQLVLDPASVKKVKSLLQEKIGNKSFVALAPSAAFPLKRWPLESFSSLIALHPETYFVGLGGVEDTFMNELSEKHKNFHNFAGFFSLPESVAAISLARGLVANDTGLLHVGEQLGKKTIALMGPAVFGFPSRETTRILQRNLSCRPCSKHGQGPCVNKNFQWF